MTKTTTSRQGQSPFWSFFFRKPEAWQKQARHFLSQTPLFDGIPQSVLLQLVEGMYHRRYQDQETVFEAGEPGLGMYLVLSGSVEIYLDDQVLATIAAGEFFGEVALFGDETRTASARVHGDTELVGFFRPALTEWVERSPRYGSLFLLQLGRVLAARLRRANAQLSSSNE
jgi:CRP/FNR family cyclic AMP-dependent transcriptional regulator